MPTLKDIARIAEVSVSTVSKALSNYTDLNPNTVANIKRIADELGYAYDKGNQYDRREKVIGVVFPEVISEYYMGVYSSLEEYLSQAGYRTILMESGFSVKTLGENIDILCRFPISGLVIYLEIGAETLVAERVHSNPHLPFVTITSGEPVEYCDCISILTQDGVEAALQHLLALGHTKIGYLGDKLSDRKEHLLEYLGERELLPQPEHIIENDFRFERCGYEGMKQLLAHKSLPTAVLASYDDVAIGAIRALTEAGLSTPEDLSVVGVNDMPAARYLPRSLTTVSEPTTDLGEVATNLLLDKIEHKKSAIQTVMLRPSLKVRETTAPPRTN